MRARVQRSDLTGDDLSRTAVLALAARLLDLGLCRVGSDQYANGADPTFGLSTLRGSHIRIGSGVTFCYPAKGGVERSLTLTDRVVRRKVAALKRGPAGPAAAARVPGRCGSLVRDPRG